MENLNNISLDLLLKYINSESIYLVISDGIITDVEEEGE